MNEETETLNVNLNVKVELHVAEPALTLLRGLVEKADKIMAGVSDVKAAQLKESQDLALLHAALQNILTAVANNNLSSADAQALVDAMNSDDSTVQSDLAAINAAIPPSPAPNPAPSPNPPASS